MNTPAAVLFIAAIFTAPAWAAPAEGLNGATGNIFKMDLKSRSFELLKETAYDPKTDVGKSRYTVHWTEKTTITKVAEQTSFAGLKGPVIADFHGIDDANSKALAEGRPFEARVAIVLADAKIATGVDKDHRQIVSWFTPDPGKAPRSGSIEVNGKPVKVSMRKRNSRIYVHETLSPADLGTGFWKTTIQGAEVDGRFVIDRMEVSPLVDPRTVDDPKLPRVLVVGDSISMNYHEAAKGALLGVANYHRNEGNSFSTVFGVANMELWLGDYKERGLHWDVIQFNHGLHDLKQTYDPATDTFGDYAVPLEDYKRNLEQEIAIMKKTGAKLIWCSTTPVPNSNKGQYARRKGAAAVFNQAAMEVMRKHPEIQVNDLYQVVAGSPVFDDWRKGNDVHFRPAEQAVLGQAVAEAVRKALKKPAT
jgi:acyl-CoA thioesterase-1